VPRRSRGHLYRKRISTSPAPLEPRQRATEVPPDAAPDDEAVLVSALAEAGVSDEALPSYRQRIGRAPVTGHVTAARPQRASRMLVTDYGYVVDELKRIGLTFGGLIVLLIVISRLLH
jgi:hypothetical protein